MGLQVAAAAPEDTGLLVQRARSGSRSARATLLRRFSPRIQRTIYFMGAAAEAEDLQQQVYEQVLVSLRGFRGESSFGTWVDRIAVRTVLRQRRAFSRRGAPEPFVDEEHGHEPEDGEARITLRRVLCLLDRMSPRRRTALVLHAVHGHSTAEIAQILGCTRITAKALVFRARRDLVKLGRQDPALRGLVGGTP